MMARAHRPLTSRPNTRLQPFRFPTIKHQLRQTCLTEESIHELLGIALLAVLEGQCPRERKVPKQVNPVERASGGQSFKPSELARRKSLQGAPSECYDTSDSQEPADQTKCDTGIYDFLFRLHESPLISFA